MPNWCQNTLTLKHADPAMIQRVVAAYGGKGLMQEFHPCPTELEDERGTTYGGDNKAEQDALRASNTERFGYANWYDWRVANWGTKWDVTNVDNGDAAVSDDELSVEFSFDSAWAPPVEFYAKMEELGFTVDAYYYEAGMAFCGHYSDGRDDQHEIKGNSQWVQDNIPSDINDMFGISENMDMWEQDEDDENNDQDDLYDRMVTNPANEICQALTLNDEVRALVAASGASEDDILQAIKDEAYEGIKEVLRPLYEAALNPEQESGDEE